MVKYYKMSKKISIPFKFVFGFIFLLSFLFSQNSSATIYAYSFIWPCENYEVVSDFGEKRAENVYHLGEDIALSAGTPVYAVSEGYVKHTGIHSRFGLVILIEHVLPSGEKIVSLYGHLKKNTEVKKGDFVSKGEMIGYIGTEEENGGWSEHLHFGIRKGPYVPVEETWVYWGLASKSELENWYDPTNFIKPRLAYDLDPYNLGKIVTAAGNNGSAHLRLFKKEGQVIKSASFFAWGEDFRGGADVATGDVNGDGQLDIIVGKGQGEKPFVKIFKKDTQELISEFLAYDENFKGGVRVAAGDYNGDGKDEIITGAGPSGGAHVRVFNWQGKVIYSKMFPFGTKTRSGIDVAACQLDTDSFEEIVVGAGPGGEPRVRIYQENEFLEETNFLAFSKKFRGGVRISCGDIDKDNIDEIIVGAGPSGGPHVRIFEKDGKARPIQFFAFHPDFRGGVDVSSFDFDENGKDEIIVSQTSSGQAWVKVYRYNSQKTILANFLAYSENFEGGANIAGVK